MTGVPIWRIKRRFFPFQQLYRLQPYPALGYDHWHYSVVARYFHNGGQWADSANLNFGDGPFEVKSTGWGYYLVVGYNF